VALGFNDGTLHVWDTATGRPVREWAGPPEPAVAVALDDKGDRLAVLTRPQRSERDKVQATIRVWDTVTGQAVCTAEGDLEGVSSLALSPDSRWLAAGTNRGHSFLWDAANSRLVHRLPAFQEFEDMRSEVAFSPDGRLLAVVAGAPTVPVFETGSGQVRFVLEGHQRTVRHVAFSPDSQRLVSASADDTVRLWELVTGQEVLRRPVPADGAEYLGFSSDGQRLLALGRQGTLRIWDGAPPK
jgi:WD40 repeat protein